MMNHNQDTACAQRYRTGFALMIALLSTSITLALVDRVFASEPLAMPLAMTAGVVGHG